MDHFKLPTGEDQLRPGPGYCTSYCWFIFIDAEAEKKNKTTPAQGWTNGILGKAGRTERLKWSVGGGRTRQRTSAI